MEINIKHSNRTYKAMTAPHNLSMIINSIKLWPPPCLLVIVHEYYKKLVILLALKYMENLKNSNRT